MVYSQRIRSEQEYLYRIAYFYQGEEQAALETVRETVLKGYREILKTESPEEFRREITRILLRQGAVNQNPNRYLTALYLKHVIGMEISGIACVMDIPEGAVKSYLHRAKDEMQQDTAGIGAEVRIICGVNTPEGLKKSVDDALMAVHQAVHQQNIRRICKLCISGAVAAALLVLLGSGFFFNRQNGSEEGSEQSVSVSTEESK